MTKARGMEGQARVAGGLLTPIFEAVCQARGFEGLYERFKADSDVESNEK
jgi:hypothetical protein